MPRVFARDELYHGPCLDAAPDLVMHFNDGYDPKGAMARTEVFGRSALTGMHTYADSLFYVNRPGVPTDDLDIVDLAPTILTLLGVEPPADMDGRVRARAVEERRRAAQSNVVRTWQVARAIAGRTALAYRFVKSFPPVTLRVAV